MIVTPARVLLWSPLIWLSGLTLIAYQVLAAVLALRHLKTVARPSLIELCLLAFCAVYLLSLVLAGFRGAETTRILAGLYNLSLWVLGLFVIWARRDCRLESIRWSAQIVLLFMVSLSAVAVAVYGTYVLVSYPSLASIFINTDTLPQNLRVNMSLNILIHDWSTFGIGARPAILAPYPTAFAGLVFLLTCLAWPTERTSSRKPYFLVGLPLGIYAAAVMAASRAAAVAFLVYFLIRGYVFVLGRVTGFATRFGLTCFAVSLGVCALILLLPAMEGLWVALNESRGGSSAARLFLYKLSIDEVMANYPLLGHGIKEREDTIAAIPIGSHSTFIGILYRTGLIGSILFAAFIYQVIRRAGFILLAAGATGFDRSIASCAIAFLVVLAFADIDAVPLESYVYFVIVALVMQRAHALAAERRSIRSKSARSGPALGRQRGEPVRAARRRAPELARRS